MQRRVFLVVAAILGCLAIAWISYILWQPSAPPPAGEPQPPTPLAQTLPEPSTQPPSPPAPPPTYRANTILALPKTNDPALDAALTATPVTLNVDAVDVTNAFLALRDASQIAVTPPRNRPFNGDTPAISLHLQEQPFLEALLQIEAQAFLTVNLPYGQPPTAQYGIRRPLPGLWSVTGPFVFALNTIRHSVSLDRDGQPSPGIGGSQADSLVMEINVRFEPKIHVLRFPMQIALQEVTDENRHSLIPAPAANNRALNNVSNVNFPLRATLAYPPQEAGRRIKTFRGTATYTLQLAATTITIDDPLNAAPSEKTINGMLASFSKCTWNETNKHLEFTAVFRRGAFTGDWAVATQGFAGIKPTVSPRSAGALSSMNDLTVSGDTVIVHFTIMFPQYGSGGTAVAPGAPALQSLDLDIPVGTAQVVVPIEFKDIPLP